MLHLLIIGLLEVFAATDGGASFKFVNTSSSLKYFQDYYRLIAWRSFCWPASLKNVYSIQ